MSLVNELCVYKTCDAKNMCFLQVMLKVVSRVTGIPRAQGVRTNSIFQYFLYSSVVQIYTIINPNKNCQNMQYNHTQYFLFTK